MKPLKFIMVSAEDRVLQVQLPTAMKMDDYLPLFAEIRQLADEHHMKNILLDTQTFRKKVSHLQWLQLARALVDNFLGYKVAGVVSAESFDPRQLAETMARNRGGNVKLTTSHGEALIWLGVPSQAKAAVRAASEVHVP